MKCEIRVTSQHTLFLAHIEELWHRLRNVARLTHLLVTVARYRRPEFDAADFALGSPNMPKVSVISQTGKLPKRVKPTACISQTGKCRPPGLGFPNG